jgi:hypothetical protein
VSVVEHEVILFCMERLLCGAQHLVVPYGYLVLWGERCNDSDPDLGFVALSEFEIFRASWLDPYGTCLRTI